MKIEALADSSQEGLSVSSVWEKREVEREEEDEKEEEVSYLQSRKFSRGKEEKNEWVGRISLRRTERSKKEGEPRRRKEEEGEERERGEEQEDVLVQFPFEPYDCQKTFMEKVVDACASKRHALLESPTGILSPLPLHSSFSSSSSPFSLSVLLSFFVSPVTMSVFSSVSSFSDSSLSYQTPWGKGKATPDAREDS